jgi:hypothetical protein
MAAYPSLAGLLDLVRNCTLPMLGLKGLVASEQHIGLSGVMASGGCRLSGEQEPTAGSGQS